MAKRYNTDYHRSSNHSFRVIADTKGETAVKYVLSFFLSVFLIITLVCTGLRAVAFNPKSIAQAFTSYSYNRSMLEYIGTFIDDKCLENSIDVDYYDVIGYDDVKKINSSYAYKQFNLAKGEAFEDYSVYAQQVCAEFENQALSALERSGEDSQSESIQAKVKAVSAELNAYICECVEAGKISNIAHADEIIKLALNIVACAFGVLSVIVSVILYYVGRKRYRALRFIAYSAGSAGFTGLALSVALFFKFKSFKPAVYPEYLLCALESHLDYSIAGFFLVSITAILVYIVLISAVWKLKRKGK